MFNPNRWYDHHAGGMAVPGSNPGSVRAESGGLEIGRDFGGRTGSDGVQKRFADAPANPGLYFHSDQGSRYSSEAVKTSLAVIGANLSMSSRGNWAKDDGEKTELIPVRRLIRGARKSRRFIASILEGHGIVEQSQDLQAEEKPPDCRLSIEQKPELSPTVLALRHAWFDVRCVSALGS
jgi:hypothetical protein